MSEKYLLGHEKLMQLSNRLGKDYAKTNPIDLDLFVTHYFSSTSRSDLSDRGNDFIYGNLRQAWAFYQQRNSNSPKIEFLHFDSTTKDKSGGTRIFVLQNDMPFLVDSIRQALTRCSVIIKYINNAVLYSERNTRDSKAAGKLSSIPLSVTQGSNREALICFDCVRLTTAQSKLADKEIRETLRRVAEAVKDYPAMCKNSVSFSRAKEMLGFLKAEPEPDYAMFSVVLRELQALAQQAEAKS